MPTLKFTGFGGLSPRTSPRLLPDNGAQAANNVKLASGELIPFRTSTGVDTPAKPLPATTVYRAVSGESAGWFSWPFDVNVVRMPFDVTNTARFAWTGDNEPKYATFTDAVSGGGNDYPKVYYALGIPAPVTAPSISHSGGVGSAVSRFYTYTFMTALGEESGAAPVSLYTVGKTDGTWAISGMDAAPLNSGAISSAVHATGVTTVTTSAANFLRKYDRVVLNGVTYSITAVTSSTAFKVSGDASAATTWARETNWNTTGLTKRLYRTSGTTATFQLVAEGITTTTYNDVLSDSAILGDDLITAGWEPPPANLSGLIVTPFGSLCGFIDNLVCFSEPFQPHAWPASYQYGGDFEVVAVGVSGIDVVSCTTANPYIITGSSPDALISQKSPSTLPCVAKRSLTSDGFGLFYASTQGLVNVTNGQASVVSLPFFAPEDWVKYNPETMFSAYADSRIYLAYEGDVGGKRILVFNSDPRVLTTLDIQTATLYTDELSGILYLCDETGVRKFDDPNAAPLSMEWKSKEIVLPEPANYGAAKVLFFSGVSDAEIALAEQAIADAIAANEAAILAGTAVGDGSFNGAAFNSTEFNGAGSGLVEIPAIPDYAYFQFQLFNGSDVVYSTTRSSTDAFRLPAGFKQDRLSVRVISQSQVAYVILAETMNALRAA